jgi:hypothetical protein
MNHVPVMALLHRQSAAAKDGEHRPVLCKHIGLKLQDAIFSGDLNEVTQEKTRDAARLIVLLGGEGQFGTAARPWRISANVASSGNYLLAMARFYRHHQRHRVIEVHVRKLLELRVGQTRLVVEKPREDRFAIEVCKRLEDPALVVGSNRARIETAVPSLKVSATMKVRGSVTRYYWLAQARMFRLLLVPVRLARTAARSLRPSLTL